MQTFWSRQVQNLSKDHYMEAASTNTPCLAPHVICLDFTILDSMTLLVLEPGQI